MKRRERRPFEVFSLSFLDCICCGFGAIILLFVLNKMGEPSALEQARRDLRGLLARLEEELHEIRGETTVLNRDLRGREEQLSKERLKVARLSGDLSTVQGRFQASRELSSVQDIVAGRLLAAQQELSEEMKRLQQQEQQAYHRPADAPVGGIQVDFTTHRRLQGRFEVGPAHEGDMKGKGRTQVFPLISRRSAMRPATA